MKPNRQNIYWFLAGIGSSAIILLIAEGFHRAHIGAALLVAVLVILGSGSFRIAIKDKFHPLLFSFGLLLMFFGFTIVGKII